MTNTALIFLGAGLGGVCRYWISQFIYIFLNSRFPYGTVFVNATGSFAMGLIFVWILKHTPSTSLQLKFFFLIGFLGGYTTFSSFSMETLALFEQGNMAKACFNVAINVFLSLGAVWMGVILGRKF